MLSPDQLTQVSDVAREVAGKGQIEQIYYLIGIGAGMLAGVASFFVSLFNKVNSRLDKVQDENTNYLKDANTKLVACVDRQTDTHEKMIGVFAKLEHLWK